MAISKAPVKPIVRERYLQATGGRKTAVARVRLFERGTGITVNDRDYKTYFVMHKHQQKVTAPLELAQKTDALQASVRVSGGGISAQADAVCNAIAKALVAHDGELKKRLRRAGFITRDARKVERKKFGLKKARRAPQWSKR